ncbi:cysteine desulfurase [Candidatus Nitromaritima sp. SCGC AAA799-C22]|nr:cysteine desulfurase [Candidatus Nitromaritima sp. SCGC AAA799-C22]
MIYLDNAATTPVDPQVIDILGDSMQSDFANSGAVYSIGLDARRIIERAQEDIARVLNIPSTHRIVFTSGGSEANNLLIKGLCFPDKKAACLELEHPSVREPLAYLGSFGNEPLSLLQLQTEGRLDLKDLSTLSDNRIRLLCLSHVNNELGTVNDPADVFEALRRESPGTRLFMDGVQAVGKLKLDGAAWDGLAGYSVSAHKFHGPKGIGFLVYDSRLSLEPVIHGGNQQYGVRSGTLPVPLIRAMALAVKTAVERMDETQDRLRRLNRRLLDGLHDLNERLPHLKIRFNSLTVDDMNRQSPAIVNFSFPPVEGEVLLHHLEEKGIYVGQGSACSAHSKEPSKILMGIGLTEEEARCGLRVSFSRDNTPAEVDRFLDEFARAYEVLFPAFHKKLAER